jgi:hypothetical protein
MANKPLAIDLFAGRFGWGRGLVAEGFQVIGFDIAHGPEHGSVPDGCELVIQDCRTIDGYRMRHAALIVASPPCDQFALWGMKHFHPNPKHPEVGIELFEHAVRIVKEAGVPFVIENVRAAQVFVGMANARCGSHYLWCSNPPALMPQEITKRSRGLNFDRGYTGIRDNEGSRSYGSKSQGRRNAKAKIAEIPFPLARHIARIFKP